MIEPNANILVINVARIGDTLLATPAIRALKETCPDGSVTCLAHPNRYQILQNLPFIDQLGTITKSTAGWKGRFPGEKWDYTIVYGTETALIKYALRVSSRVVAFAQRSLAINSALFRAVAHPTHPLHAVHERLLLPRAIGADTTDYRLAVAITSQEAAAARTWLQHNIPSQSSPIIGMQVSSFPTKAYRDWPIENFISLGKRIICAYPRARLLLLGSKYDRPKAERVRSTLPDHAINVAGNFGLRETSALMQFLDLYIGVDTGPTHIAGALGIPMVALYHCFHRGSYLSPLGHSRLQVIEHPRPDTECKRESEMSEITVDRVWNAVKETLNTPPQTNRQTGTTNFH